MSEVNTLIFDWDGTLADSIAHIVEAMQSAAVLTGVAPCSDQAVRDIIGLGLPEAVAQLYPEIDDLALRAAIAQTYAQQYRLIEQGSTPLYEGVMDALESFRGRGFKLAVATGKSRRGLERILAAHGLSDYFDATRCADETLSKPDPLMLQQILAQLAVTADQALMVGDSEFDMRMAHNAGMRAVAVSYGAQSREQLLRCNPVHCLDVFSDFHGWVMPLYGDRLRVEV